MARSAPWPGWRADAGRVLLVGRLAIRDLRRRPSEAAFADALDLDVGDSLTLNGRSFRVVGVADALITIPARLGARRPVAEALRSEHG